CDLYESTVLVLDFITEYIQDGTIIIFDDWFSFRGNPNRGEQKAFKEWLKKNPSIKTTEFYRFGWHGNSFITHRDQH
ncbi:MAG: methyltransferase, partial [Nanoarchaeota archaeon]|nr:methyltransferase [Nanoarchaeota archaeon]